MLIRIERKAKNNNAKKTDTRRRPPVGFPRV